MTQLPAADVDDWDPVAGQLVYASTEQWVTDWLVDVVRRRARGPVRWCPRWWDHREAVARLGALWAAWEAAHAEGGTALSQWWTYHFEGQWNALTSAAGPFAACTEDAHRPDPESLQVEPIPTERRTP